MNFKSPFTCVLAGPTQCGKTTLIFNILKNYREIITPVADKIIYCYWRYQDVFDNYKNSSIPITFHQGLPEIENFDENASHILILDDLTECENDKSILDLFTVDSHHKNISVFFLCHNIFSKGRYMRTINLNSHYLCIFKNP
jgi:predicted AAA+ superfamily ATPase